MCGCVPAGEVAATDSEFSVAAAAAAHEECLEVGEGEPTGAKVAVCLSSKAKEVLGSEIDARCLEMRLVLPALTRSLCTSRHVQ